MHTRSYHNYYLFSECYIFRFHLFLSFPPSRCLEDTIGTIINFVDGYSRKVWQTWIYCYNINMTQYKYYKEPQKGRRPKKCRLQNGTLGPYYEQTGKIKFRKWKGSYCIVLVSPCTVLFCMPPASKFTLIKFTILNYITR